MHQTVRKAYECAGIRHKPAPADINEDEFFEATEHTPGGLKKRINQMWRVKKGKSINSRSLGLEPRIAIP
jgi:hypothetical protein